MQCGPFARDEIQSDTADEESAGRSRRAHPPSQQAMTGQDHKRSKRAEEEQKRAYHFAMGAPDPGEVSLRSGVAVGCPQRAGHDSEQASRLQKHLLGNRVGRDLIDGEKLRDQKGIDFKKCDAANLESKEIEAVLVNSHGGRTRDGGKLWLHLREAAA